MSTTRHTTRHHLNRQRRLAAVPAQTPVREKPELKTPELKTPEPTKPDLKKPAPNKSAPKKLVPKKAVPSRPVRQAPRVPKALVALCLLTLLLGTFAGWAFHRAQSLDGGAAARNSALSDPARTSEVKGQAEKAVEALFSYDQADPGAARTAAGRLLTGKAVEQHRKLLAPVLAQAEKQKTVVTTTVTDSAVERIDGARARVLVFADQSSTGTAAKSGAAANYAGAMLAVDLVRKDGRWLVSGIDTFGN
ncbi:hypothetical protein [Streptomyces sp. NPDC050145]|uniref:hypothetical protein n=1 Tax=Streptomyces sp. NPDC050145 TaxID=3365602 RepID=UPI0037A6D961